MCKLDLLTKENTCLIFVETFLLSTNRANIVVLSDFLSEFRAYNILQLIFNENFERRCCCEAIELVCATAVIR